MSGTENTGPFLTAALPAVADELTSLALEIAALGEDLSSDDVGSAARTQAMQKFDALSQAIGAYAHVLRGLAHAPELPGAVSELLDKIPFFDVRERIRSKICLHSAAEKIDPHHEEIWFEC
ncbi:MAG TPA: hypothetical protein VMU31_08460 [Rhizomicrobium sp.]|nr:hypothetical protein [Rhizomicrobium sp.]